MGLYQNRIVVKVGTSTLTNDMGQNDLRSFDRLACVLADVQNMGYEIILVSSGAIAVGANKLNMKTRPSSMRLKQASAAVGQCRIMYLYDKFFGDYDKTIAQILLNAEDIEMEEKKENLTNTFDSLLEMGIIPIVNENDSVSYTEIESEDRLFGDNDMLSSVVAVLCRAKKLVIFSDIDGFYNKDPRLHPDAKLIERITDIDEDILSLAGGAGSRRGTGGMKTKLQAARLATSQGIDTIITNGNNPASLYDIVKEERVGTLFAGKRTNGH
ncbi:glutamate 5-kinase [Kineothrix sp. MB12-C1]|uniref:glutamate 5-kinase n=1 Tax=Kineothrix sp. MB12-C1 TaxID=3070215 RepID=UPI0027D2DD2B|nr:glutamate 5-kinase [Kineothrix sp. MB12-C1]WMC91476.1 glutamate 5-kinase [Kineothrix sp. MB12-C1]